MDDSASITTEQALENDEELKKTNEKKTMNYSSRCVARPLKETTMSLELSNHPTNTNLQMLHSIYMIYR